MRLISKLLVSVQGQGLCLVFIPDFQVELKLFLSNYWTLEESYGSLLCHGFKLIFVFPFAMFAKFAKSESYYQPINNALFQRLKIAGLQYSWTNYL